jgi:hypothetical protein
MAKTVSFKRLRLAEACPGQSAGTWDLLRTVLDEGLESIDLRLHELCSPIGSA